MNLLNIKNAKKKELHMIHQRNRRRKKSSPGINKKKKAIKKDRRVQKNDFNYIKKKIL